MLVAKYLSKSQLGFWHSCLKWLFCLTHILEHTILLVIFKNTCIHPNYDPWIYIVSFFFFPVCWAVTFAPLELWNLFSHPGQGWGQKSCGQGHGETGSGSKNVILHINFCLKRTCRFSSKAYFIRQGHIKVKLKQKLSLLFLFYWSFLKGIKASLGKGQVFTCSYDLYARRIVLPLMGIFQKVDKQQKLCPMTS